MNKVLKIILIPVAVFFIFNLYVLISNRNDTQYALPGVKENCIRAEGYMIKDETIFDVDENKKIRFYCSDGEKIAKGARIAVYLSDNADASLYARLLEIDEQIKMAKSWDDAGTGNDAAILSQKIKDESNKIIEYARDKNFVRIAESKNKIVILKNKMLAAENGTTTDVLKKLSEQKKAIEKKLPGEGATINAPVSGVIYLSSDGYETVLYPEMIRELTVNKLANIEKEKKQIAKSTCKITNNFIYYIACTVSSKDISDIKEGNTLGLRFTGVSSEIISSEVEYISPTEKGKCVIVFSCNKIADELLSVRNVKVDIVKNRYEGFCLPASAVKKVNGVDGVYVKSGVVSAFKKVKVIYKDKQTVIVSKTPSDENELHLYDNVVVRADKVRI